jgi:hypothetical protein
MPTDEAEFRANVALVYVQGIFTMLWFAVEFLVG